MTPEKHLFRKNNPWNLTAANFNFESYSSTVEQTLVNIEHEIERYLASLTIGL